VRTALLLQNLNGCSQILEIGTQQCKDDINKKMDLVVQRLAERKKVLKEDMVRVRVEKGEKVDQQLQIIRSYQRELEDGKKQYEQSIADSSLDVHSRKKRIIGLVNELTGRKDVQLTLITQPKLRLGFENQMVTSFLDQLNIDDCDQPPPPSVRIDKISFDLVVLEIACDDDVLINKATEFAVEVAIIHTESKLKLKRRKPKEKKKSKKGKKDKEKEKEKSKKKKKKESDAESASGSESEEKEKDSSAEESEKGSDDEDEDKSDESEDKSEAEDSADEDKSEEEKESADESENDDKKEKTKSKRKKR